MVAGASAQQAAPLALDPSAPGQGTTLVVAADGSLLSRGGQPATSVTFALARGMRVDTGAVTKLCSRGEAERSACPPESRIGFGLFNIDARGYDHGGGETRLTWAIDAYLGEPRERADAASVVLLGKLLGADLVGTLLAPSLGTSVPSTTTTVGRLVRTSGKYGVELQFAELPARLDVRPPATATPARLELSLGAVRRVRKNFTRRVKVPTPSGYEIRKIRDHRLVGRYLLRTPRSCRGSWASEVRTGVGGRVVRTPTRIACGTAPQA